MFIPSYLGELSIEREKGRAPQRAFGDKKLPEHIVELGHIFGEIHWDRILGMENTLSFSSLFSG